MMFGDGAGPLDKLSSEELVALCRKEDRLALTELIKRFVPSVRKRAESFAGGNPDDLMQEGFLALLDAVRNFDPDRGAGFTTFALSCIRNRMINVYKKNSISTDELTEDLELPDDDAVIPENIVAEQAAFEELSSKITAALSKLELSVFRLYVRGMSYEQIAEELGVPEKSVDNAVQRMRRKLKEVL